MSQDVYTYEKVADSESGLVTREFRKKNGVLHCEDGPARIRRYLEDNGQTRVLEEHFYEGALHRMGGGPAMVLRFLPSEEVAFTEYYDRGRPIPAPD